MKIQALAGLGNLISVPGAAGEGEEAGTSHKTTYLAAGLVFRAGQWLPTG